MHTIMTLQVYPTEITPRLSPSQANIQRVSPLENDVGQLGNGVSRQFSQMETDEQSSQSQVISYQQEKPNKEWIYKSIQEGSIRCYPKGDIDVRLLPIGGAYGAVHEAKMNHNRLTVVIKTLYRNAHDCEEKFYRKLAKEVSI